MIELVCTAGIGIYSDRLLRFINKVMNREAMDDSKPLLDAQVNTILYTYALAFKLYNKLLISQHGHIKAQRIISRFNTVSYQRALNNTRLTPT